MWGTSICARGSLADTLAAPIAARVVAAASHSSGRARTAGGPLDLEALVEHVRRLPQPFRAAIEGRIVRRDCW